MKPVQIHFTDGTAARYLSDKPLEELLEEARRLASHFGTHVKHIKYQAQRKRRFHESL